MTKQKLLEMYITSSRAKSAFQERITIPGLVEVISEIDEFDAFAMWTDKVIDFLLKDDSIKIDWFFDKVFYTNMSAEEIVSKVLNEQI